MFGCPVLYVHHSSGFGLDRGFLLPKGEDVRTGPSVTSRPTGRDTVGASTALDTPPEHLPRSVYGSSLVPPFIPGFPSQPVFPFPTSPTTGFRSHWTHVKVFSKRWARHVDGLRPHSTPLVSTTPSTTLVQGPSSTPVLSRVLSEKDGTPETYF